ncbi:hypothetical protein L917_14201 [Phytophthora nicotianae]|uniref:Uncharacterized protein n=1 Tax=Phytophthora nicotianae TaxID=4792 RepID=W2KPS6_PHYNI|nr:hypothetical protein L917_14201 [Phytophthora nicotianae]
MLRPAELEESTGFRPTVPQTLNFLYHFSPYRNTTKLSFFFLFPIKSRKCANIYLNKSKLEEKRKAAFPASDPPQLYSHHGGLLGGAVSCSDSSPVMRREYLGVYRVGHGDCRLAGKTPYAARYTYLQAIENSRYKRQEQ